MLNCEPVVGAQALGRRRFGANGNRPIYNAEDFADAGLDPDDPPVTWEQPKTAAERLTVPDDSGTSAQSGPLLASQKITRQQTFQTSLTSSGGTALNDAETEAAWDSPESAEALECFASLYNGHTITPVTVDLDGVDLLTHTAVTSSTSLPAGGVRVITQER